MSSVPCGHGAHLSLALALYGELCVNFLLWPYAAMLTCAATALGGVGWTRSKSSIVTFLTNAKNKPLVMHLYLDEWANINANSTSLASPLPMSQPMNPGFSLAAD